MPVIRQLLRERFDDFEYFRNLAFVVGEHDTLRQNVGNNEKSLRRHVTELNWSACLNLILGLTGERNDCGFFLKPREFAPDPGLQFFQKANLVLRRKADQHRHAIAEKNSDTGFAGPDRERTAESASSSKPMVLIRSPTCRACAVTRVPISAEMNSGLVIAPFLGLAGYEDPARASELYPGTAD